MSRAAVFTPKAPSSPNLHSQAIIAGGLIFTSGAVGKNPETGQLVTGSVADRTHQCIRNLSSILEAAGSSLERAVEVNVFLADMADYAQMNAVYEQYWGTTKPARTCVAVKTLPGGTDVEIKCVAVARETAKL